MLILVIALVVAYIFFMFRTALNQRVMIKARRSRTLADFLAEFEESNAANLKAIEFAYEDLEKLVGYSVKKTDELESALGLLPEDFESVLEERSRSLGVENIYRSQYARRFPLLTVGDYVLLLDEILKNESTSSSVNS